MRTLILLLTAVLTVPVLAHHAEAPFYDMNRNVSIKGVVTKWQFRNPHPFLFVEVADDTGVKREWTIEFVGAVRLAKVGWSAKTFTPGETVSVSGHPSRAPGTYGISSASVARADGKVIPGSGRGGNSPEVLRGAVPPELRGRSQSNP
jgi:DNA/RNA endonuclease YhcR with UshA esterase domain